MSAHGIFVGLGPGTPTPPVPPAATLIWDEPFNQADINAFLTQYNTNDAIGWDPDDITNGWLSLSGGTLQLKEGAVASVDFGPDAFTPVRQCWLRVLFSITGGDFPPVGGTPCKFHLWGDDTAFADYTAWDTNYYTGPTAGTPYELTAWGSLQDTIDTALSAFLPAGTYAFYFCVSEPTSGVLQAEIWVNPSPGDAPLAVATSTRNGSGTISRVAVEFQAPTVTSNVSGPRTTVADRCTLYGGARTTDPFGIL